MSFLSILRVKILREEFLFFENRLVVDSKEFLALALPCRLICSLHIYIYIYKRFETGI